MNQLTTNNSLLSRDESTSLKGLLILLIVLGHDMMLNQPPTAKAYDEDFLPHRLLLYYFHVHCFFILPMIYGYKQKYGNAKDNILNDIKKAFVKTMVPYTYFCILFIIFNFFRGFHLDWGGVAWAYIVGEQSLHACFFDEHFLWFLPAMFALMVWKSVYYNSHVLLKSVIFYLSIGLIVIFVFRVIQYNSIIWNVLPFSLMRGLYYLSWGIIVRYIIERKWSRICVWGG